MPPKSQPQMHIYDNRLASFEPIAKPKARARHGWPLGADTHPLLTPANMASAGFYYSPGGSDPSGDNCICFLCGVNLGGWAKDDNPHKEHVDRGNCAWAETICQVVLDRASSVKHGYKTTEDLPSSATYSYVRENTYYSKDRETCWWPHIKNKKHQVNPQNLAKAGFVFTPSAGSPDLVQCPLCRYDVEQWDEDDDPMEQHRRKHPNCLFFTAQVTKEKTKRAPRITKKTKPVSDAEIEIEVEAEEPTNPESRTTATSASSRSRTRKQTSEAPSEPATRSKSVSTSTSTRTRTKKGKKPEVEVVDEAEVEDEDEGEAEVIVVDDDEIEVEQAELVNVGKSKPVRGGRKGKKVDQEEEELVSESQPSRAKGKKAVVDEPERVEEKEEYTVESAPAPTSTKSGSSSSSSARTKSATSSKSSRKPVPVQDEDVEVAEIDMETEVSEPERPVEAATTKKVTKTKPRTTKASKAKSKPKTQESGEEENGPEVNQTATEMDMAPISKIKSTAKSTKPLPPLPPPSPAPAQTSRPLSQLDRFANIPPSSPVSAPVPRLTKPIPKKMTSQPNRPTPPLPTPIPNSISDQGKVKAKEVIQSVLDLISPLQPGSERLSQPIKELSEEQLGMSMENWIKAEMRIKRGEIEREGKAMIGAFEARTKEARRKIESLPTRL